MPSCLAGGCLPGPPTLGSLPREVSSAVLHPRLETPDEPQDCQEGTPNPPPVGHQPGLWSWPVLLCIWGPSCPGCRSVLPADGEKKRKQNEIKNKANLKPSGAKRHLRLTPSARSSFCSIHSHDRVSLARGKQPCLLNSPSAWITEVGETEVFLEDNSSSWERAVEEGAPQGLLSQLFLDHSSRSKLNSLPNHTMKGNKEGLH